MPNEALVLPTIGSEEFWVLYDKFCSDEEFKKLSDSEQTESCLQLQQILREGHGRIVGLERQNVGWTHPNAWLVLRHETIMHSEGYVFMHLQPGDVMTREFGWDRDVFITHAPIIERVSGQFLNQHWYGAKKGLFLPLYTKETIMSAIRIKLERNSTNALAKAKIEAREWQWY